MGKYKPDLEKEKLQLLLKAYLDHSISDDDCRELMAYSKDIDLEEIDQLIDQQLLDESEGPTFSGTQAESVLARIKKDPRFLVIAEHPEVPTYKRLLSSPVFRIAAVLVMLIAAGLYIVSLEPGKTSTNALTNRSKEMIPAGTKKAVLILADGKKILLNETKLTYDLAGTATGQAEGYNTIQTPNGGEYQVKLPDGTLVWLNSASSLTYPTKFSTAAREVTLKGEAYFEVSRRKTIPFHVNVKGTLVEVLGTHFNISAYDDDKEVATTLLEGSVRVSKNRSKSLLLPGQQSVLTDGSDEIVIKVANTEEVMAWHNGYFRFNDEDIRSILKKVSRWYDVEVEYRNTVPGQKLGGMSYRTKSLNDLLEQLEKIGNLHFKLEGRRIIVVD